MRGRVLACPRLLEPSCVEHSYLYRLNALKNYAAMANVAIWKTHAGITVAAKPSSPSRRDAIGPPGRLLRPFGFLLVVTLLFAKRRLRCESWDRHFTNSFLTNDDSQLNSREDLFADVDRFAHKAVDLARCAATAKEEDTWITIRRYRSRWSLT